MLLEVKNICKSFESVSVVDGESAVKDASEIVVDNPAEDVEKKSIADVAKRIWNGAEEDNGPEMVDVLKDISFTLDKGQSLALVAPSGTGKSTLLSIVGLLLEPTSGTVMFDGIDVTTLNDDERSKLRAEKMGFLFQHTQLIGSLRAIENVSLAADFIQTQEAKLNNEQIEDRAKELLCGFGLEDRMYHFPYQLSIGQKRRIATARALFLKPELIIADEPTNDLDPVNSQRVIEALFARVKTGEAALLYATHDKDLAAKADKILELK